MLWSDDGPGWLRPASMAMLAGMLLVFAACSGMSSAQRDEAFDMCVDYELRYPDALSTARPTPESADRRCSEIIDVAEAEGCDFDATIRYIAASLRTRPHEIRHEEVWFAFHPIETRSAVLEDC